MLRNFLLILALGIGSWAALIGLAIAIASYLGLLMPLVEERYAEAALLKIIIREIML